MHPHAKDHEGISREYYKNDFDNWDKEAEISYNNNEVRQKEKYRFFQLAYDYLSANGVEGDYYEFGCHRVRTFRMSLSEARKKNLTKTNFYAFDSFEGLPDVGDVDKFAGWERGMLKTSDEAFEEIIKAHGVYPDRVHKIKGFYKDSLTPVLQDELMQKGSRIAIAYVDCDLYESAVCVLDFIEPLLQEGAIICFDDWNVFKADPRRGEKKAFSEFRARSKWHFEDFITVGWFGKSFIAGRQK